MPELPEAETIVRGLRPEVSGKRIRSVRIVRADILRAPPAVFLEAVTGSRIRSVERRGKNVLLALEGGGVVWINLGMTGRLFPAPTGSEPPQATHPAVVFDLGPDGTLTFDDTRRFGSVEFLDPAARTERSASLGPEPLGEAFTTDRVAPALAGSRTPVRSWLLDQKRVAGVGNIYANEALWRARIHPRQRTDALVRDDARRLVEAVRQVLREAVNAGGTTLRDYRNAEGAEGEFGRRLDVYGRDGDPCRRCDTPIERIVFSNRSAFLCPECQREEGR